MLLTLALVPADDLKLLGAPSRKPGKHAAQAGDPPLSLLGRDAMEMNHHLASPPLDIDLVSWFDTKLIANRLRNDYLAFGPYPISHTDQSN